MDEDSMHQLLGSFDYLGNCSCVALPPASMQSYRIAVGPQAGRKVFAYAPTVGTLRTVPACDDANEPFTDAVGKGPVSRCLRAPSRSVPGPHLVHAGIGEKRDAK